MSKITLMQSPLPSPIAKKRVAAYARVSLQTEALHRSLSAQISYYSSLIQQNSSWTYVGVYADEGITGTSTKHRTEFNRLIEDCDAGRIDIVLVKSISRFARNTVDCLNTIRHLRDLGIAVCFEREHINTLSADGELLLTLLASFAQEEARSISENVKWATRKRFEQGIPNGHKAPYGYRWDGEMFRVIPERGAIVQEVFRRYISGESAYGIAAELAVRGITGQGGKPIEQSAVKEILSNISYTGTMLLQKYYHSDIHIRKKNNGELPMYLVDEMFEPLISEEDFHQAQAICTQRAVDFPNHRENLTPFSGLMKCGCCGSGISRRTTKEFKKWVCNTRERKGITVCDSRPLKESELYEAAAQVVDDVDQDLRQKVQQITVFGDRVEFQFKDGPVKTILRTYDGTRGNNPYANRVFCPCGEKCIRHNVRTSAVKVWKCPACGGSGLREKELNQASGKLFGAHYGGCIVEKVKRIQIDADTVTYEMKDGGKRTWQRQ